MFLNNIKSYVLRKTLKKCLRNLKNESLNSPIVSVGLIIDESDFSETASLKSEIISNGVSGNNIKVVVFRDLLKSKEVYVEPTFGIKDINFKSQFTALPLKEFISEEFDVLISYYNEENPFLMLLTDRCKAKFKVGFSTIDKRLNHFSLNIGKENYRGFVSELFRYLKILNKI
jgi:hypothetical protein